MKLRLPKLLVLGVFACALLVTAASGATSTFATGMFTPESITPTGSDYFVTDAGKATDPADPGGEIWKVKMAGGTASMAVDLHTTTSLRGGMILPATFPDWGGRFLFVGGDTTGAAVAGTMDTTTFSTSPLHSQANGLWTEAVLAPNFGLKSGDVLVTNQGKTDSSVPGSVDYFTPSGGVGTLATFSFSAFPSKVVPFGAALAKSSFGEVGGPSLFVSDSNGNGIYTVDPAGNIKLFTTIPVQGTNPLRQIAFAPKEWKKYGGDLFVSLFAGAIDVVNRDGVVVGSISGSFKARGMLFTTMSGHPTLLFSNTLDGSIVKAGPGDVVPS